VYTNLDIKIEVEKTTNKVVIFKEIKLDINNSKK